MDDSANKSNRSTAATLLSEKRAKDFVAEKFGIETFDEKFRNDKVSLLNEIVTAWQNRIPFQTVSQIASTSDPTKRGIPTMKENVSSILSLRGGCCWTHNAVMHTVLHALGYDVILGIACAITPDSKNHVVTFAKNLTAPNSFHVVEVGLAFVSPKAICLDFEKESEVVDNIYGPYKYTKYEDWLVRCHKSKPRGIFDIGPPVVKLDGWDLIYYFKLQVYTYEQVKIIIGSETYHKPDSFFNQDLFNCVLSSGKFVFLHNRKLKIEKSPGGEVEIHMLEKDEQLLEAIFQHFPTIPEEEVMRAFDNWKKLESGLDKNTDGEKSSVEVNCSHGS